MADITEQQIRQALDEVSGLSGIARIGGVHLKDGHVQVALEVDPAHGAKLEPLRQAAERAVAALPGVLSATAVLTAEKGAAAKPRQPAQKIAPPGVRHIVAVASGKGGVGKSTIAANLALAAQLNGLKVGLLDADIYGPSVPRLLGLEGQRPTTDGQKLAPLTAFGMPCMSIGFLIDTDTPMIWRGPMVSSALQQMLRDVDWGELDILFVDMPPGTGDAQLTLAQQVALSGAVIVSTPQDIALIDARKGLAMFRKVEVPVLGLVENMSWYHCPQCGHEAHIFAHGGAERAAAELDAPFLGALPLDIEIRETSDDGQPLVISRPGSPHAERFRAIAATIAEKLEGGDARPAPRIVMG